MKKIVNIFLVLLALIYGSCKEQDEMFRKYVVENGLIYPGKAKSVKVRTGKSRVEISWINDDPTVIAAKIYWNNYQDSKVLPICRTENHPY